MPVDDDLVADLVRRARAVAADIPDEQWRAQREIRQEWRGRIAPGARAPRRTCPT